MSVQIGETPARLAVLFESDRGVTLAVGGRREVMVLRVTPGGRVRYERMHGRKEALAWLYPDVAASPTPETTDG